MQGRNATVPLGPEIMQLLGSIYGLQTYKSKDVNFWNGIYWSDIGGFAEQPSGDLYARWIQLGVFILSVGHTLQGIMEIRSHGHLMNIIDITRKFVNLRYQLLPYLYTMFWQYIEEGIPMLKPLVYYDKSDIQTHYRNDNLFWKPNSSMSY
jgi:alpha-glucosidase